MLPAAFEGGIHFETKLNSSAFSQTYLHILITLLPDSILNKIYL